MKLKTNKKIQKQTDIDCHFKYRCYNKNCNNTFWLSLKEAQTKNFKIVCDCCGVVFYPKRIKKIKVIYTQPDNTSTNIDSSTTNKQQLEESLLEKCSQMIMQAGFNYDESVCLATKGIEKTKETDARKIVTYILKNIGDFDDCN